MALERVVGPMWDAEGLGRLAAARAAHHGGDGRANDPAPKLEPKTSTSKIKDRFEPGTVSTRLHLAGARPTRRGPRVWAGVPRPVRTPVGLGRMMTTRRHRAADDTGPRHHLPD